MEKMMFKCILGFILLFMISLVVWTNYTLLTYSVNGWFKLGCMLFFNWHCYLQLKEMINKKMGLQP